MVPSQVTRGRALAVGQLYCTFSGAHQRHHRLGEIRSSVPTPKEVLHRLDLRLRSAVMKHVELFRPQANGLVLLRCVAREDHHVASQCRCKLYRHMPQTSNSLDADAIPRLEAMRSQRAPDGSAAAHQWSRVLRLQIVGELDQHAFVPDRVRSERPNLGSVGTILLSMLAVLILVC